MLVYTVIHRRRAIKEYSESLSWYKKNSFQASEKFKAIIDNTIDAIVANPHSFKKSYKNFFVVKTKIFPFSIVYFIEEEDQQNHHFNIS